MRKRLMRLALVAGLTAGMAAAEDIRQIDSFELEGFSWLKRSLRREPPYRSRNVRYAIWVLGEGKKSVMTIAWDESGGTGKGYDTLYVDRNFNGDLTEPGERFFYEKPPKGGPYEHYEVKGVKEAGGGRTFDFTFDSVYNHDELEYRSEYAVKGPGLRYKVGNLPWSMKLKWADSLKDAPVYRFGGVAIPIVSYEVGSKKRKQRLFFFPGEKVGEWEAGQSAKVDVVVALMGNGKDVQFRFNGSKFPGVGKGIQGLRWGKGGYPLAFLRVLGRGGSVLEDIQFDPGCP